MDNSRLRRSRWLPEPLRFADPPRTLQRVVDAYRNEATAYEDSGSE